MEQDEIKSIGIVRIAALGDVILTIPTVRALQKCYPHAKITWVTCSAAYKILEGLSGVEFIVFDRPENIIDYWRIYQRMKPYYFDVLLCMQASFRANLFYPLIRAKRHIGFDRARANDAHRLFIKESVQAGHDHLLDAFMRFAQALNCHPKNIEWSLAISDADKQWALAHLPQGKKILAVNPASSKKERWWFADRFIQVLQEAKKRWDVNIVLTGGPDTDEKALAAEIEQGLGFEITNLVGKTTPKQLAAVLEKVDVLLAPDTGPSHIAVAMGTPVIGMYAIVTSALSAPYFSKDLVIDKYDEAVKIFLKKDPATIPWKTRVHTQQAMGLITVDDVLEKLMKVFEPSRYSREGGNPEQ